MKKISFLLIPLLFLGFGCSATENPSQEDAFIEASEEMPLAPTTDEPEKEVLAFLPDGLVLEGASNPGVKLKDGVLTLLFEDRGVGVNGNGLAQATSESDWLDFTITDTSADLTQFHATKLSDGTYRSYLVENETTSDPTKGTGQGNTMLGLISESSQDGVTFTKDEGYRYILQPGDNGAIGVWETFVDNEGGVVLLYIGDKYGQNNIRRAYSTDNGWTFTFDRGNVLGDEDDNMIGTYVDQNILSLGDGVWKLITMRQGSLYLFESADDGYSFRLEGEVLGPDDFEGHNLATLNDPKLALLPDGRLRIYVTGVEKTNDTNQIPAQSIYSATTKY